MFFSVRMSKLHWIRFFDIFHLFCFFREFWTSLTRMSLRSSTRQEHTYSTLVEKIYTTTRERVHECLRNVIPCVLYFLRVTLCPASSWEIIRLVLWYICLRNISKHTQLCTGDARTLLLSLFLVLSPYILAYFGFLFFIFGRWKSTKVCNL